MKRARFCLLLLSLVTIISSVAVGQSYDPKLFSAMQWRLVGPHRGVFKSTNGGKTWNRVFFKDEKTSVVDLEAAPDDPRTIFAATYNLQIDPANRRALGADSQIFKSTDEGETWQQLPATGLPPTGRGTIGLAVAPTTKGQRVYAIINSGIFRFNEGGANFKRNTK